MGGTTAGGSCGGNAAWIGDNACDDVNNNEGCQWDGGDCCGDNVDTTYCQVCACLDPGAEGSGTTTNSPSDFSSYSPNDVSCNDEGTLVADSCNICPYKLYISVNDYNEADYDQEHFEQENSVLQYLYCKGDCYWNSTLEKCQQIAGTFLHTCNSSITSIFTKIFFLEPSYMYTHTYM